jgi:hypothetical protein
MWLDFYKLTVILWKKTIISALCFIYHVWYDRQRKALNHANTRVLSIHEYHLYHVGNFLCPNVYSEKNKDFGSILQSVLAQHFSVSTPKSLELITIYDKYYQWNIRSQ